jgi:hydroxymethylbilane synthase
LAQLSPQLEVVMVRGNLATRVRTMESQGWFGLILAAAGVHRLGWQSRVAAYLDPFSFVPAPGQGIVAVEVRAEDVYTQARVREAINHPISEASALAERAVLRALGGGCQMPLGSYAVLETADSLRLVAKLADASGHQVSAQVSGSLADAEGLGYRLAERMVRESGPWFEAEGTAGNGRD